MYEIKTQEFEGPLTLLLKLIEQEKLDITKVSLAAITDQYLVRVEKMNNNVKTSELADFLLVASRLLAIKSEVLVPSFSCEEEDGDGDLERQLKMYKAYRDASIVIRNMIDKENFSYSRLRTKIKREVEFFPPKKLTVFDLKSSLKKIITDIEKTMVSIPKRTVRKIISLSERIAHLKDFVSKVESGKFGDFIKSSKNKSDIVVSFLAILELAKQRNLIATQEDGGEIIIKKYNF